MKFELLVIDDDVAWTRTLCDNLRAVPLSDLAGSGFDDLGIEHVTNQEDADRIVLLPSTPQFHLILLDLNYPKAPCGPLRLDPNQPLQGMVWLPELRRFQPNATIVILTAWAYEKELAHAVAAIRDYHANDFLPKTAPFKDILARLSLAIQNARQRQRLLILDKELWLFGATRAARVFEQDVTDLLTRQHDRMDRIAQRIESGDSSAIAAAPDTIRAEMRAGRKELDELTGMMDRRLNPGGRLRQTVDVAELTQDLLLLYDPRLEAVGAKPVGPEPRAKLEVNTFLGDLKMALHEVITNAIEAMASSRRPRGGRTLRIALTSLEGNAVIQVEDNGEGFSHEAITNLFKLGKTTRDSREHVGMGLYVARRAMIAIGGDIKVESRPEGGARVQLFIPNLK
jgi:signal transduction histidine kinase